MITLKQWMEVCDYRITEGSAYGWQCFGPNAYRLDSWNGEFNGHTVTILFDTKTQEVYQVEAFDYKRERAYRMTNPHYLDDYKTELKNRSVSDEAWEREDGTPVTFTDLEVDEDWLEKAASIVADEEYDQRVQVPLTLPDDEIFQLMKMAHEHDMSLNQFVEKVLLEVIDKERSLGNQQYDL